MSNNKQSSIEFLIKQKEKWGLLINDDLRIAKAMHKDEIIQAIDSNFTYHENRISTIGEQYYNEIFGGNNDI